MVPKYLVTLDLTCYACNSDWSRMIPCHDGGTSGLINTPDSACPKCGSEDLEGRSDAIVDGDREGSSLTGYMDFVYCKKCGWEKNTSTGEEYFTR